MDNTFMHYDDAKSTPFTSNHQFQTCEEAIKNAYKIATGEMIAIPDENDLSEIAIYKRTNYKKSDLAILRWDGTSVDTSWFRNPSGNEYFIENAEQLAGLKELVENGFNFKDKIVTLTSNINLGFKEWDPIGGIYKSSSDNFDDDSPYLRVTCDESKVFQGTFNGNGHVIYALSIHTPDIDNRQWYTGLFKCLKNATVKNLAFSACSLGSDNRDVVYSCLFGYAKNCKFINVTVDGQISGEMVAGIGCIAFNCSFIDCVNYAEMNAYPIGANRRVMCGGLVLLIGLSSSVVEVVSDKSPKMFERCVHAGKIRINAKDAKSVMSGYLYACTMYRGNSKPYGFSINRCCSRTDAKPVMENFDDTKTLACFYGHINGSIEEKNIVRVDTKMDLLSGLIGKTNVELRVNIVKETCSTKIEALVIPGSMNTLSSAPGNSSFITENVAKVTQEDRIENLYPYYSFVKFSKM